MGMGIGCCRGLQACPPSWHDGDAELHSMILEVRAKLQAYQQEHLLDYTGLLSPVQLRAFLDELNGLNLDALEADLLTLEKKGEDEISPFPFKALADLRSAEKSSRDKWRRLGLDAIRSGEVAVVLVAGGQGTRLGYNKPKGMYNIGLPSNKSLFQLQAEKIQTLRYLAAGDRSATPSSLPWYVMTSDATHEETVEFLFRHKDAEQHRGGLPARDVKCFPQAMMPCVAMDKKKLMLATPGSLAKSPNGNGGIYQALRDHGILGDMQNRGIKYIHVYCVDNALTKLADPYFIGYCIDAKADAANKVLPKRAPTERVGVMCLRNGKPGVCEYSEISEENMNLRDKRGDLVYGAANICSHFFTTEFLAKFLGNGRGTLPFHVAKKKIPTVGPDGKWPLKPTENNGIKLEMFIFDIFAKAENMKCFMVPRESEFSPVKNAPGIGKMDAPDVARSDVNRYHISLLKTAGFNIPEYKTTIQEVTEAEFSESTLDKLTELNTLGAPKFVLIYAELIGGGMLTRSKSWCPDCVTALPLIEGELKTADRPYHMLKLPVKKEGYSGNPDHKYRTHPKLAIDGVPTLHLWQGDKPVFALSLGDSASKELTNIKAFLKMAFVLSAPNVEISSSVSYDGEGLDSLGIGKTLRPPLEIADVKI